jgi:cytochrome c oxidase cbb3-type subunit 3
VFIAATLVCSGCQREKREYTHAPSAPTSQPAQSTLRPGGMPVAEAISATGLHYERNAYHITQGGHWYKAFNCSGCHSAGGGGGMGPPLIDDAWRYGGNIDQIHATIVEGRPNGMPAWRGKITDVQAWQLAAYVRAMSGNVSKAAAPSRREGMAAAPPATQMPKQPPHDGDPSSANPPAP